MITPDLARPLRVLHLEDSPRDAAMVRNKLDVGGVDCDILLVNSKDRFEAALTKERFDLIISDYSVPGYDGPSALKRAQETQPDTPVILISGTVGEEEGVRCLHIGATDYLLKQHLERLAPAVQRALLEAETRRTRKRVETALRESEARKAAILDSVLDCIVTVDMDGIVIELNSAATRTFGYSKAEMIGRSLADLIIPARFRDRHTAGLERYRTTGVGPLLGQVTEIMAMRSDGSEIPVELAITAIQSGSATFFTGVLRDITARKDADATRSRLAAIVESSDDAIFSVTLDDTILTWNTGAERLYGYAAVEMIGRNRALLAPDGRNAAFTAMLDKAARGEAGEPFETQRMRKDGSIIDISLTISPMTDALGRISSVSAIARDITGRKRDEAELKRLNDEIQVQRLRDMDVAQKRAEDLEHQVVERREAEAAVRGERDRAQLFLDTADVTLLALDVQGRITLINRSGCDLLGWTERELLGRDFIETCIPAQIRDETRRKFGAVLNGPDLSIVDNAIVTKAGDERMVEWRNTLLRNDEGLVVSTLSCGTDLTVQRRLDEERVRTAQLERSGREAQQANRLKSEFLANMSHELRTPLNAIIGFTALMHKGIVGPVSAVQQEYLGDILTSSNHLLQLINDVLDLAKVESGKIDLRPRLIDLAQVVNEVRDVLRGLAAGKRLRVETEVDPGVMSAVLDPARVKQILYNYLSNAIKFTSEGGRVEVRLTPDGSDRFRIDVTDTGPGIAAEDLKRLFVEFQQLDSTASKQHQGTGLGLALTKRLVEAHGGHVSVRSTVGVGSTFSAVLPRMMAVTAQDDVTPVIGSSCGNRTLLVVDNDPFTVKLAETVLRNAGYQTVSSNDGEAALVIAAATPPAAVIVDLVMPGMDGFEFIARFRATPGGRDVPILVWTIKDLDADERRRLEPSTVTIISKRSGGSDALVEELRRIHPLTPIAQDVVAEPILIIDDDPQSLELARVVLCAQGYEVKTATDAEGALKVLATFTPRLILLDVRLPGMDGLELTRRLKADPAHCGIGVVAVTAHAMKGDDEKAFAAGCDGHISKPIDIEALPRVVAQHLDRKREERARPDAELRDGALPLVP